MSLITIIGRGHSGTRVMSRALVESGVYMGAQLNQSYDLIPAEELYEACRVMARHVVHKGGVEWDFSPLRTMPIDPEFKRLVESYLASVLSANSASSSDAEHRGWKLPETTLIYPWIVRMFPDVKYLLWLRDPRDCVMGAHITDDLSDFGVPYDKPEEVREMRAISWKYQWDIVKATPPPKCSLLIRIEDFCLQQDETLARLEAFLGFPVAKFPVSTDPIGRWKNDTERHDFDFLKEAMSESGYH